MMGTWGEWGKYVLYNTHLDSLASHLALLCKGLIPGIGFRNLTLSLLIPCTHPDPSTVSENWNKSICTSSLPQLLRAEPPTPAPVLKYKKWLTK